jgi:pimeloyl-ACP methyl ester carboxylesterase
VTVPTVDRPGCRLSYTVIDVTPPWAAQPETILFHHGVSATGALWSDWVPVLCDAYRLVLLDTRGFGRSVPLAAEAEWSMEVVVGDLLAVAAAEGLDRFHLVGESAGGTVAMAMAAAHPGRIRSLTVSNAAHKGTAVRNVRGVWQERIAESGQADWAARMMEWRFFPGALPPAKHRWFLEQQARCSAEATLGLADLLLRTDLTDAVGAIRAPMLILSPDSSPFVPVEIAADLHARVPGSELQVFAHARHGLPLSHGRICAQVVRDFLRRRCGDPMRA